MELTRRSFLAGIGSVSVGLLFARKLDAVIDSLVAEQQTPDQQPSAAEIVVQPQTAFRAERLVVSPAIAMLFVIENIRIGEASQFVSDCAVPAALFSPDALDMGMRLDAAQGGTAIAFRVRYVGDDPRGARFVAALFGTSPDGGRRVLPIDSGYAIVDC